MLRDREGITQKDLARKIDVTTEQISRWERGVHSPNSDQVVALAQLFGVSCDYLLLGTATADHGHDEAYHRFLSTEAGRIARRRGWLPMLRGLAFEKPTVKHYVAVVRAMQISEADNENE